LDTAAFPWAKHLEENWTTIREEAEHLLRDRESIPLLRDLSSDHKRIADTRWKSFFLWGYGYRVDQNCSQCPRTAALVSKIPGLNTALFSILEPGAKIAKHNGVTKHLVTYHLALITPVDVQNCLMRVDRHIVHWESGRCFMFDDTYRHQVWNNTPETRVILLVQVKRPSRFFAHVLGEFFLFCVRRSRFVQEARRNISAWQKAQELTERA